VSWAIVDDFTRECLILIPDTFLPGLRVPREYDVVIGIRGRPAMIVSDNGTECMHSAWATDE
jgi:putative transposase